jgi:hypothetical protein
MTTRLILFFDLRLELSMRLFDADTRIILGKGMIKSIDRLRIGTFIVPRIVRLAYTNDR